MSMPFVPRDAIRLLVVGSGLCVAPFRRPRPAGALRSVAARAVVLLALGAVVSACAGGAGPAVSSAPVTSPASSVVSAPAASTALPPSLDSVCQGQSYADATPYAPGNAPAPVYFSSDYNFDSESDSGDGTGIGGDFIYAQDGRLILSEGNSKPPKSWGFSAQSKVQLVACVDGLAAFGKRAVTCSYGKTGLFGYTSGPSTNIAVNQQPYTISLYVATTGKLLARKIITGGDKNVCPTSIDTSADVNGPWSTILSISDINTVIGAYASR
jgi:hypothetical protein